MTAIEGNYNNYRNVFDNSTDIIYLVEVTEDERFIHRDINHAFIELTGVPREELIDKYIDELKNEELRDTLIDKYTSCLKKREKTNYTAEYNFPSGSKICHSSLSPIKNSTGRIYQIVGIVRDITERVRMEEELKKRELEYKNLTENLPDAIVRYDKKLRRTYVNPEWERINGLSSDDVLGKTPIELSGAISKQAKEFQKKLETVLVSDCADEWDFEFKDIYGKINNYSIRAVPEYDIHGKVSGVLTTARNITQRKQEEEEKSSEQMRLYFEKQLVGMAITSPSMKWIRVNEKLCTMLGYSSSEFSSMGWDEMTHSDDLYVELKEFTKMLDGEIEDYSLEKRFIHKSGTIVFVNISVSCVRNDDKSVDYVLTLIEDITERVCAQETLHSLNETLERRVQSSKNELNNTILKLDLQIAGRKHVQKQLASREQMFRGIVENLPGFTYTYRLSPEGKERFIYASKGIYDVYGVTSKSALEDISNVRDVIHPDDIKYFRIAIEESARTLEPLHVEFRVMHSEKGELWLESKSTPQKQDDGSTIWHGITLDITDRKEMNNTLIESQTRLSSLISAMPDMVWMKDIHGKYVIANKSLQEFFGASEEELIGKTDYDLFEKSVAEVCLQSDKEAIQNASLHINEESFIDPHSGENGVVETRKLPVYDAKGEFSGVLGIGRDITETKRQAELLEKRELEFRSLANNLPDNIVRFGIDGTYLYINPVHERTLGVEASKILGKRISEEFPHHTEVIKGISHIVSTGESIKNIRQTVPAQNGETEIHEVSMLPERDVQGKIVSILGIGRDITEQVKSTEELLLKDFALDGIVDAAYLMDENGMFHYVNEGACNALGYTKDELLTMGVVDIDPDISLEVWKTYWSDITKEKVWLGHVNHKRKDGSLLSIDINSQFFEYNGKEYAFAICRDITKQKQIQEELSRQEEQFRTIMEHTPDTVARYDKDCIRTYANPSFAKIAGKSVEELVGKKPTSYFDTPQTRAYEDVIRKVFDSLKEEEFELSWQDANGQTVTSLIKVVPEIDSEGKVNSVLATGRNVTALKEFEIEIKKQKDFQDSLLQGVVEAGLSLSVIENGRYIYTNNYKYAKEYGYDAQNLSESTPDMLTTVHPDDREKVMQMYEKRLKGEDVPNCYNIRVLRANGDVEENEISVVLVPNTEPQQIIVVTKDVTEKKRIEQKIEHMAHHDTLTGLPNRVLATQRAHKILEDASKDGSQAAILFIDLDGFKTVNDSLGHSVGDKMLKIVASRLKNSVRVQDTVSRQGGDEFLVILPDINDISEVTVCSDRMLKAFETPFIVNKHIISTSASIGIALYPDHGSNFEQLLQCSDAAMYKAKEEGKNNYCFFTQKMKHDLIGLFKMQNDLKEAIKNKEFMLHYQPQIDLSKNRITGAEALLRWNHPEEGMIPPINFIPVAESSGLILEIGEWVLMEACRQAALWNKEGKNIVVAVNISAVQFRRGNLEKVVKTALSETGLEPKYLELELTESIMINDTETVLQTVKVIKELGIQLSIDDFGTGYSSLAYLKRFAVDKLKIDQSFVKGILNDKDDANIVKTIIQMAKSFNLRSIAEGVENEEVLAVISEFGCDEVQGYHYARPMNSDDFDDYCKQAGFNQ